MPSLTLQVTWWWLTAHIANVDDGSLEGAAAQNLLERIENTHPQFPLAVDDINATPGAHVVSKGSPVAQSILTRMHPRDFVIAPGCVVSVWAVFLFLLSWYAWCCGEWAIVQ